MEGQHEGMDMPVIIGVGVHRRRQMSTGNHHNEGVWRQHLGYPVVNLELGKTVHLLMASLNSPHTGSHQLHIDTNGPPLTIWELLSWTQKRF